MRVLGYGRAAREVCEQALWGGGCFGHLMQGSTEFSGHFFPVGQKALRGACISIGLFERIGKLGYIAITLDGPGLS